MIAVSGGGNLAIARAVVKPVLEVTRTIIHQGHRRVETPLDVVNLRRKLFGQIYDPVVHLSFNK